MATGTNGIATEGEAKSILEYSGNVDTNKCITKARALEMGADSSALESYTDEQLVKYGDLSISKQDKIITAQFNGSAPFDTAGININYDNGDSIALYALPEEVINGDTITEWLTIPNNILLKYISYIEIYFPDEAVNTCDVTITNDTGTYNYTVSRDTYDYNYMISFEENEVPTTNYYDEFYLNFYNK